MSLSLSACLSVSPSLPPSSLHFSIKSCNNAYFRRHVPADCNAPEWGWGTMNMGDNERDFFFFFKSDLVVLQLPPFFVLLILKT